MIIYSNLLTRKSLSKLGGTTAGLSAATIFVNSSAKLLVSSSWAIWGTKGGSISRFSNFAQLKGLGARLKKACSLSSLASRGPPPNRWRGSLTKSFARKSRTSAPKWVGIGGSVFRIRLEISCCVFFSPSTVNGEAPVRSSYANTPTLHQSTAWNGKI